MGVGGSLKPMMDEMRKGRTADAADWAVVAEEPGGEPVGALMVA